MNTTANAISEMRESARSYSEISAVQSFFWSVKREFWEYRSLYLAPVAVAGVYLFAFLIGTVAGTWHKALNLSQAQDLSEPYQLAAGLLMGTTFVLGFYYSLECMHGERRDRSILFWKSLPVSDMTTVMAKAFIPVVALPLITFIVAFATELVMLLLSTGTLAMTGRGASSLWQQLPFWQIVGGQLYHLLVGHVLWYAPIYAYLILVSAWAKRAPVLWAALPPLAIGFGEKLAFGTTRFANLLSYRLMGGNSSQSMNDMMQSDHASMMAFVTEPGLWIGLAFAAVCLVVAARIRRLRG
jgi:ABC-2 type transport system permease protein